MAKALYIQGFGDRVSGDGSWMGQLNFGPAPDADPFGFGAAGDSPEQEQDQEGPVVPWVTTAEMKRNYPNPNPPVIRGLLRKGEVMNLIGQSKVGKSWLTYALADGVAAGGDFLGWSCIQGRVLIVDNELQPGTLADRFNMSGISDDVLVWSLRGQNLDVNAVGDTLKRIGQEFDVIILDALYRFWPEGMSENDNNQVTKVYNYLGHLASATKSAIVCVHHASKGNQADKTNVDVGSGAGAISRATDVHLTILQHQIEGLAVVNPTLRSWADQAPFTVGFNPPVWEKMPAVPPEVYNPVESKRKSQQQECCRVILERLAKQQGQTTGELTAGLSQKAAYAALHELCEEAGRIRVEKDGNSKRWYLTE